MPRMIFVNLPVADLEKSVAFFTRIGFTQNQQFSDETAACMVVSETICVMLLTTPKFAEFTPKAIADATRTTEVLTCLSAESRDEVDHIVDTALAAGGSEARPPMDLGFMFNRSFNDLDGHIWEIVWMDPAQIE